MYRWLIVLALAAACHGGLAQVGGTVLDYNLANQHTYLVTPWASAADYHASKAFARTLGGYLASINDAAEQNYVFAKFADPTTSRWIGLSDQAVEGTYVWDSGEPLTYQHWDVFEPNNATVGEDYVQMLPSGLWNDNVSPASGTGYWTSHQGIVELAYGERINFEVPGFGGCNVIPSPLGAPGNPEGISWNGAGAAALHAPHVTQALIAGMPISGKYLFLHANGPVAVPVSGPAPYPPPAPVNEVRIPVPKGMQGISFAWDFLDAEPVGGANDGCSIAIVNAAGQLIQQLVYADNASPRGASFTTLAPCGIISNPSGWETLPAGPNSYSNYLVQTSAQTFLSIMCWNGANNTLNSAVTIDAIQFWGTGRLKLAVDAPTGPGSFRMQNSGGGAFNPYVTAVTLAPGAYPFGWFYGVDISMPQLLSELGSGPPFTGVLNASGGSTFTIPSGVPPGIGVYAVSVEFTPSWQLIGASSVDSFVTP
jgi:Lectin C-type domain